VGNWEKKRETKKGGRSSDIVGGDEVYWWSRERREKREEREWRGESCGVRRKTEREWGSVCGENCPLKGTL